MVKPAFIFVPGAGQTAEYLNKVLASLTNHGYTGTAVPLPSVLVDGNSPTYDFSEDVSAIRKMLLGKLVEEHRKDVVVVVHSYSGLPSSEALKESGKTEREERGLQGVVTRMVFIVAFASPENVQLSGERGETLKMMPEARPSG